MAELLSPPEVEAALDPAAYAGDSAAIAREAAALAVTLAARLRRLRAQISRSIRAAWASEARRASMWSEIASRNGSVIAARLPEGCRLA